MGWQLGVWACLALLSGIQYPTVYAFLIVGLIWGLRWLEPGMRRAEYLRSSLAAVGLVLLLCSWRLVPSLYLLGEFPRDWDTLVDRGPLTWMALLWQRPTGVEIFANADRLPWETVSYVGPVVLLLAVWSVTRGWQWWHTLMVMCFLCALGSRWW